MQIYLNFSAQTSSRTQEIIESKLEKKKKIEVIIFLIISLFEW